MKTTFKKSVLAFLTCVLGARLCPDGCSGGAKDPKADFVGSWELSGGTVDGEELTDEYMKMLEDWGVHCVLILDEDGTGALDLFLEVVDLKWEAKDAHHRNDHRRRRVARHEAQGRQTHPRRG